MDLQYLTPEIHVLPVASGVAPPTYRIPTTTYDTSIVNTSHDSKIPSIKILNNTVQEDQDGDYVIGQGTVTASDIKFLYESNPDTNAFTDESKDIVDTIEESLATETSNRQLADAAISAALLNYLHNDLKSIQGGNQQLLEFYHLTSKEYSDLNPVTYSFTTVDWSGPSAGYYTLTIVHNLNSEIVDIGVVDDSNQPVEVDRFIIDNNSLFIRVPALPDLRFNGFLWIKTV